jgi:hypothetical protein
LKAAKIRKFNRNIITFENQNRFMEKEIYLIRGVENESYDAFAKKIFGNAKAIRDRINPEMMKVVYTAGLAPGFSVIPFRKTRLASISIVKGDPDPVRELINFPGFAGAYRVTEALPVVYKKTWPDNEQTPGICLLTLFNRKKGLDYETFIHRWHNSHTPLSLKIHPLWNYSRNVVNSIITENSEKFEGIVEEQMRTDAQLLNPFRFFGNPLVIIPRMIAVYRDTKSFIDYSEIETYLTREIIIKS